MDEVFDWINSNTKTIEDVINGIQDLEFLEILKDIDSDGQNRRSIDELVTKRSKYIKIEVYGFSLNLLDRLLNHVPFYQEGKTKELISKEMRKQIFERDDYTCQLCNSWHTIYCHHIDPQGLASEDNLITLCLKCHEVIHRLLRNKKYPYHVPVRRY